MACHLCTTLRELKPMRKGSRRMAVGEMESLIVRIAAAKISIQIAGGIPMNQAGSCGPDLCSTAPIGPVLSAKL